MEKSDLRSGMWVKLRSGEMMMVLLKARNRRREADVLVGEKFWNKLESYADDLKVPMCEEHDITEIWLAKYTINMTILSKDDFDCIWKREETCHITQNEAERTLSKTLVKYC